MSFLKKILKVASGKKNDDRRAAFRVEIPLLRAKLSGKPVSVSVRDISATGISLNSVAREFSPGNQVVVNLFMGAKLLVADLMIEVVRVGKGYVGGKFVQLTTQQADFLHSLTLDEQKKLADIKKKEGEKGEKAENGVSAKA